MKAGSTTRNLRIHRSLRANLMGAVKYALRLNRPAGKTLFPIYPDDVFIASFPKSGNTWVRFLTANLLWPEETVSFETIDRLAPDIYKRSNAELAGQPRPRILKSHEPFDPRYPRVIYIVRDPRSVLVSYWAYQQKMGLVQEGQSLEGLARTLFQEGDTSGTWQDHVAGWLEASLRSPERVIVHRYEHLRESPGAELARLAAFLGVETSPDRLKQAVEASSFESMKLLEAEAGDAWQENERSKRKDIPFVRSGRIDEWRDFLGSHPMILDLIEQECGPVLQTLGCPQAGNGA